MIIFIRAKNNDKQETILNSINCIKNIETNSDLFLVNPHDFTKVPGLPFSYWVSNKIRTLFTKFHSLEGEQFNARVGIQTSDDFRFLRLHWEIDETLLNDRWFPYAKGGAYSPIYGNPNLVVNWLNDGKEMKVFNESLYGGGQHWSRNLRSVSFSFRPGLTWTQRTNKLGIRIMPKGCMFGIKGPAIFSTNDSSSQLLSLLAITQSQIFHLLVEMQMASASFDTGVIQRTPLPPISKEVEEVLSEYSKILLNQFYENDTINETSYHFCFPRIIFEKHFKDKDQSNIDYKKILDEINLIANDIYNVSKIDIQTSLIDTINCNNSEENNDSENHSIKEDSDEIVELLSWAIGILFSRFSINYKRIFNEKKYIPFSELNLKSLARHIETIEDFTIKNGIIVEDLNSSNDFVTQVISVLKKSEIPIEIDIRNWLRKDFFKLHLKKYSDSRRYAPIYWPLQTQSGSYTLWIYYHRLNDQILYTCVNDFVEPKLKVVNDELNGLRNKSSRNSTEEKELEKLTDLEVELKDFRDELLRTAKFWKPNLNDGVQITAAPLWKLFQHKQWQKKLKETWEKLEKGDYDWAHLAYNIWPERVLRKCHTDRSFAIAHDVEEDFWEEIIIPVKRGKPKTKWQPKKLTEQELKELIQTIIKEAK